jgi:hypothetical protein
MEISFFKSSIQSQFTMKVFFIHTALAAMSLLPFRILAQSDKAVADSKNGEHLYLDVHHLGPGKVTAAAVAEAHAKDLAVQRKYGVHFLKYWVDEAGGDVYCLSSSADTQSIRRTHAEAHGLLPDQIYPVTEGKESATNGEKNFYLDIHDFGTQKVTPQDVAAAHQKDLAVEGKYGVNFINYWVNGSMVVCLSQAPDSSAVINTHKEAHGLIPQHVMQVKPGEK